MISHDCDQGFVVEIVLTNLVEELAYTRIDVCNFAVVGLRGKASLVGFRRIVRIMRVVEMNPQEERPVRQLAKPRERMIHNIAGAAFDRLVAVSAMAPQVESGIVDFESAIEARSGPIERIKD